MSSQVKKRFAEMTAYLGKDTKGRELLKQLHDAVNVLRKNLAAAAALAADEEIVKNLARERAAAAECEVTQLRVEVQSLRQQVANLTRAAVTVTKTVESEEPPVDHDTVVSISEAELYAVFNNIKKQHPVCPTTYNNKRINPEVLPGFYRETLATGWSYHSLWTVGAVVSFIVAIRGGLVLRSHRTFPFLHDRNVMQKLSKRVAEWYRPALDDSLVGDALETLMTAATEVKTVRDELLKDFMSKHGLSDMGDI